LLGFRRTVVKCSHIESRGAAVGEAIVEMCTVKIV
jgi:hypothetical protein